jgi:hypothetical protein
MSDETLLPYIEDTVYSQLVADLDSDVNAKMDLSHFG